MPGPRGPQGRQDWRTPPWFYDLLNHESGGFDIDAAADSRNHLAFAYYSLEDGVEDAFAASPMSRKIFVNPPYGRAGGGLMRWVTLACRWMDAGNVVYALLPSSTETKWFLRAIATANEVRLITPRLAFLDPDGVPVEGNMGASILVVWDRSRPRADGDCPIWSWNIERFIPD